MDDDKVVLESTISIKKTTLEYLFKMIFILTEKATDLYVYLRTPDKIFTGNTEWNKFMTSLDDITIKDLKNNQVNLDKFKEELEKYGIGFSFYKHSDGENVSIAFLVKHKDIVEKAMTNTLEEIIKKEDFVENVSKKPGEMDLDEKLNYYKEKQKEIISNKKEVEKEIFNNINKKYNVKYIKDLDLLKNQKPSSSLTQEELELFSKLIKDKNAKVKSR